MPGGYKWDDFQDAVEPAIPNQPKAEPLKQPQPQPSSASPGPQPSFASPTPASEPASAQASSWDSLPDAPPPPQPDKPETPTFDPKLARGWAKLSDVVDTVNKNIASYNSDKGGKDANGNPVAKPAETWQEAIQAGWQGSFPGLTGRGKLPDITAENLPGIKGWMLGMASHMTTMIAEIPEMAMAATAAGAAVTPASAAAGPYAPLVVGATGAYAAFAVPSLLRRTYWDHLAKGNVNSFQDFWERTSAGILEAHNEGLKGVGAYAAGAGAAEALGPLAAGLVQKGWSTPAAVSLTKTGVLMSEVAGMSGVGAAIDHKMPSPTSIAEALVTMGAFHAAHYLSSPGKALGENFARTGMGVDETAAAANKDPALKTQIMSENPDAKLIAEMSTGTRQDPHPGDTWYHGTASKFENFDPEKLGVNTEAPSSKKGFFFTSDPKVAAQYAEYAKSESVQKSELAVKEVTEFGDKYGIHNENYMKSEPGGGSPTVPLTEENLIAKNPDLTPERAKEVLEEYKGLHDKADASIRSSYKDGEDQTIYVAHLNLQNPLVVDFHGAQYRDKSYSDIIDEAKAKGNDGVIFKNTHDAPFKTEEKIPPHDVAVAFDKDQIEFKYSKPPKRAESPPEKPDVGAAMERIAATIGTKEKRLPEGVDRNSLYQKLFSQFDPVKRIQDWLDPDAKIPEDQRPFTVATLTKAVKGKMVQFLKAGTLDFKTNEYNGKGLFQILEPLEQTNEVGKLSWYMKVRRSVLDLEPRGIKTGMDPADTRVVYDALKERFEPYAKEVTQWSNRVTQYAIDAQLLPKNWLDKVEFLNEHYVKYSAIFEDEDGKPTGRTSTPGSFKKIKGGDYITEDPLLAISQNMMAIVKNAEANKAKLSSVNLVEKDPDQKMFETVSQARPVDIKASELRDIVEQHLGDHTLEEEDVKRVSDAMQNARIWRRKDQRELAPNEFEVKRDGVSNIIRVNDTPIEEKVRPLPLLGKTLNSAIGRDGESTRESIVKGEDFANAMKSLNGDVAQQNFLVKAMQGITKSVKFGSTITGEFLTFHALNNKILSAVQSQYGAPTTRALFDAMSSIFKEDPRYQTFLKDGGGGTYFDLDENYLNKNLGRLEKETGGSPWNKMYNLIPNTFHAIENVGSMLEQSYRMVEYEKTKGKALGEGASPQAAGAKAAMDARSLTVDYDKRGLVTSGYNAISSFTNMKLQHMDRVYQGLRDPETNSQMIIQGLKWITFPSMILKLGQMNNPRVQQANQLDKDMNWIIDIPFFTKAGPDDRPELLPPEQKEEREDGTYINRGYTLKLRAKGALALLFKVIPERIFDSMAALAGHKTAGLDPDLLKSILQGVSEIAPGFPDAPKPILEQALNKNFFTGHPVVTNAAERVLPAEQYTNYTSATARALGKLIGSVPPLKSIIGGPSMGDIGTKEAKVSSPEVIDNYIQDYSGGLGKYVTFALDQALYKAGVIPDTRPAMKLTDIPFIKAFIMRYPQANSASIEEFRDKQEQTDKLVASVKFDMKRFQPGEAEALMQKNQQLMFGAKGIEQQLHEKEQQIQKVFSMPLYDPVKMPGGMTKQDKGQLIDGLYYQMIYKAKMGNEMLDQIRKTIGENTK